MADGGILAVSHGLSDITVLAAHVADGVPLTGLISVTRWLLAVLEVASGLADVLITTAAGNVAVGGRLGEAQSVVLALVVGELVAGVLTGIGISVPSAAITGWGGTTSGGVRKASATGLAGGAVVEAGRLVLALNPSFEEEAASTALGTCAIPDTLGIHGTVVLVVVTEAALLVTGGTKLTHLVTQTDGSHGVVRASLAALAISDAPHAQGV